MKRDVSNLLSTLSVDQLLALQVRLTELVAQRTREQIAAVFSDFASRAGLGGSPGAAPTAGRKRKTGRRSQKGFKVPVKYRDPANPGNTWTGRGVPPRWLRAYLDAGHQRDEYLIVGNDTAAPQPSGKRGGKKKAETA